MKKYPYVALVTFIVVIILLVITRTRTQKMIEKKHREGFIQTLKEIDNNRLDVHKPDSILYIKIDGRITPFYFYKNKVNTSADTTKHD